MVLDSFKLPEKAALRGATRMEYVDKLCRGVGDRMLTEPPNEIDSLLQ